MNTETAFLIAGLAVLAALAILFNRWQMSRAEQMLESWSRSHGFHPLSREHRLIRKGPFLWTSSKGQVVYRVSMRDPSGRVRSGYARCGGYWLGVWTDAVDIRWDG